MSTVHSFPLELTSSAAVQTKELDCFVLPNEELVTNMDITQETSISKDLEIKTERGVNDKI